MFSDFKYVCFLRMKFASITKNNFDGSAAERKCPLCERGLAQKGHRQKGFFSKREVESRIAVLGFKCWVLCRTHFFGLFSRGADDHGRANF